MIQARNSKQQLALRVVGEHFGATVQSIAQIIADSEFATLSHIYRTAKNSLQLRVSNSSGNCFFVDPSMCHVGTGAAKYIFVPIKRDANARITGEWQ